MINFTPVTVDWGDKLQYPGPPLQIVEAINLGATRTLHLEGDFDFNNVSESEIRLKVFFENFGPVISSKIYRERKW